MGTANNEAHRGELRLRRLVEMALVAPKPVQRRHGREGCVDTELLTRGLVLTVHSGIDLVLSAKGKRVFRVT